jgi:hypothetical protein
MNINRKNKIVQTLQDMGYSDFQESDLIAINEIMKDSVIDYENAVNQWSQSRQTTQQNQAYSLGFDLNQFINNSSKDLQKSLKKQIVYRALCGVANDFREGNFLDIEDVNDLSILNEISHSLHIEPSFKIQALAPVLDNVTEYES